MLELERRREEFEYRIERDRREFEERIEQRSENAQRRNRRIDLALVITGLALAAAQLLTASPDSIVGRWVFSGSSQTQVAPEPNLPLPSRDLDPVLPLPPG